ncbi:small subunit ribosomal protein S1 [Paenibacillus sp. PastF-3]|uniref:S1 RNA-binding domain-containing protein n=1 Tax=unclassified Paenibacillus TaxID=185978 RepID=UPI000BA0DF43|nr:MULTISPECIES: S1 RNA-binding domain-containing protein [unclassified Paenibacillus]MBY3621216.1 30S ribosomal protein S1 [Acinetobacter sp. CUI P1]MDH6372811.1 small subunit ribosomal protein S1 [Paenibacillus sp. PastF-3]OZQ97386.1 hypothetical protein CA598_06220 [Paenibacillus sp. VTT E-133291]
MKTTVLNETDVLVRIVNRSEKEIQEERESQQWQLVYSARQNRSILRAELRTTETIGDKLCAIVYIGHIKGIIPFEETGFEKTQYLKDAVGQEIYFKVLGLDKEAATFVASVKEAKDHLQGLTLDMVSEGTIVVGSVTRVNTRSLRLDVGALDVELAVDEVSYQWIDDLRDLYVKGDDIEVKVLEVNKEKRTLKVSAKALYTNPWPDCTRRYAKNNQYGGKVSGIVAYGVFVNLEAGVDVLCTHPAPNVGKVRKGDKVKVRIREVLTETKRMTGQIKAKL